MKREFSAGGLVYKKQGGRVVWLIRRPTGGKGYKGNLGWSFPKGWLDDINDGNDPGPLASGQIKASEDQLQQAALKEVGEEGGVEARIVKKLSTLRTFFTNQEGEKVMKFITYYLMEYRSDSPAGFGWETAETKWIIGEEIKLLAHKNEKELLVQALAMVK